MPQRVAHASPITHVTSDAPPCLLIHGEQDELVPVTHSERLHTKLVEAGVDSVYRRIPGAGHGFENYPNIAGLIKDSVTYLRTKLGDNNL